MHVHRSRGTVVQAVVECYQAPRPRLGCTAPLARTRSVWDPFPRTGYVYLGQLGSGQVGGPMLFPAVGAGVESLTDWSLVEAACHAARSQISSLLLPPYDVRVLLP